MSNIPQSAYTQFTFYNCAGDLLQSVQYDLQHDFAWVTDEAYCSVVFGTAAGCLSWEV